MKLTITIFVFFLLLIFISCSDDETDKEKKAADVSEIAGQDSVVGKIDGKDFTIKDFVKHLQNDDENYFWMSTEKLIKEFVDDENKQRFELDKYLNRNALYNEAVKTGFDKSEELIKLSNPEWNEEIVNRALMKTLIGKYVEDIDDFKEKHKKARKLIESLKEKYKESYSLNEEALKDDKDNNIVLELDNGRKYSRNEVLNEINLPSNLKNNMDVARQLIVRNLIERYVSKKEALKKELDKTDVYKQIYEMMKKKSLAYYFEKQKFKELEKEIGSDEKQLREYYEKNKSIYKDKKFENIKEMLKNRLIKTKLFDWKESLWKKYGYESKFR